MTDASSVPGRPRGRPRSNKSREAILNAAYEEMASQPLDHVTIEAIAARAGASKATIYRWWPQRFSLFADALSMRFPILKPVSKSDDALQALRERMQALAESLKGEKGRILADLIMLARQDQDLLADFHTRFLLPRRKEAADLLARAQVSGRVDPSLDADLMLDMFFGPLYYRLFIQHQPLSSAFVDQIYHTVCDGVVKV